MRKKVFLCMVILCSMVMIGCGQKVKVTKMTATLEEVFEDKSRIESKIELTFSNDKLSSAKEEKKFTDKNAAEDYYNVISMMRGDNTQNVKIEISGRKVTETTSKVGSSYKFYGMTQNEIKTFLETDGWTVN